MRRPILAACALVAALGAFTAARADHASAACTSCADHQYWPQIDGFLLIQRFAGDANFFGTSRSDELLGHHGSDTLRGGGGSDVLWGDYDPSNQPTTQHDTIDGGDGTDFIYGSHGTNTIYAGPGNDAISVHYGAGLVDCGPGRDIYHVARSRAHLYRFVNCEKVDYRPEKVRGHGLKPLP